MRNIYAPLDWKRGKDKRERNTKITLEKPCGWNWDSFSMASEEWGHHEDLDDRAQSYSCRFEMINQQAQVSGSK